MSDENNNNPPANEQQTPPAGDDVAALKGQVNALSEQLQATQKAAIDRYRLAVAAAHPEVPPERLQGDSFEAIDASVQTFQQAFQAGQEAAKQAAAGQVTPPTGFARHVTDPYEGLSAEAKIAKAIEERRKK